MFQVLKILTRITPCNTDISRISVTAEGYTGGIIGFTTGTGDLPDVVELSCCIP